MEWLAKNLVDTVGVARLVTELTGLVQRRISDA